MLGIPKFSYGEKVTIDFDGKEYVGTIAIVDKYGTFFDDSDVSYDILVNDFDGHKECLVKHINEKYVKKNG